jgi:DNA topoisomerase-1
MDSKLSFDQKNYKTGIARNKINNKYQYFYINTNKPVSKIDKLRIDNLKIPPNWINVWVSSDKLTPIQVVGIDSKGRKQYRYNQEHIKKAEKEKFLRLEQFIQSAPKLNTQMLKDKKKNFFNKNKVIQTMLQLVKELHIRVGKECYAKTNKSYGISSLKKSHATIKENVLNLNFKGKSNKRLHYTSKNKYVIEHIEQLLKLDGDKLFQYRDQNNNIRRVTDTDLNQYIQEYMGKDFTCKDFRTYAANFHFVKSLLNETSKRKPKNDTIIKKNIKLALEKTAFYLKHTKAISKKSYIMNFTVNLYSSNPAYFIDNKNNDTNDVLLNILKLYKQSL